MSNIGWLFSTSALKIAPADSQFWYTSGLIGPYYINTHFVCGGEKMALSILSLIDESATDVASFPQLITDKLEEVYKSDQIYRELIDDLCTEISKIIVPLGITHVSGGQRRDWFFSPILAKKLNLPPLYIYNDKSVYGQDGEQIHDIHGGRAINTADLLTVGSSYTEKWIPALRAINGSLVASANVVDRSQGGRAALEQAGIGTNISIFTINNEFFDLALKQSYITSEQHQILRRYFENQDSAMRQWLRENPTFLEKALNSPDEKTRTRAKNLIDKDLYQLKS